MINEINRFLKQNIFLQINVIVIVFNLRISLAVYEFVLI